jgi:N-acetylglucosamine-6-phosphate deacetylase
VKIINKNMRTVMIHGTIITPFQSFEDGIVMIEKGKIVTVTDINKNLSMLKNEEVIDAQDKFVVPGFIDIHVHGGGGADVMDGEVEAIQQVAVTHSCFGTTAFLPTTMTMSKDKIIKSLKSIQEAKSRGTGAAIILGIHLEGPYINPEKKGAQKEEDIKEFSVDDFLEFNQAAGSLIRLVTIAPEKPESIAFIQWLCQQDIIASVGHSNATYQQVQDAVQVGLSHVTHLFNAMRGLHHREPGVVGAALSNPRLTVEMIADGIHLHPVILRMVAQIKEREKVMLMTDAMRATGLEEGTYELGGQEVIVDQGQARLRDGTLAGSVLTMDKAVRNMVTKAGISLFQAVQMASYNPAKRLGIEDRKGSLEPGKDADVVILNKNLEAELTMVSGNIVYRSEMK